MADLVEEIMSLWQGLPADEAAAEERVGRYYADPVVVNGTPFTVAQMTSRARNLQAALSNIRHELLERVEQGDKLAIAFVLRATHTGPWQSPLGEVPASGEELAARTIDVLTFKDGKIAEIVVVSDELGMLNGINALALA